MQFPARTSYLLLAALLSGWAPLAAQTLTITRQGEPGLGTAAVTPLRTAPDYATDAFADPWDFEQASDFVYMFSEEPYPGDPNRSSWASVPSIVDGHFVGLSRLPNPQLQLLFEGIGDALNVVGRNGVRFPIDSNKYRRLSFRMKRPMPQASNSTELIDVQWWKEPSRGPNTSGFLRALVRGYNDQSAAWENTSPVSQQGMSDRWHIYKIDLDERHGLMAGRLWTEGNVVRGLRLVLGEALQNATVELDWVRLTQPGTALVTLSFSGFYGRVTVTARHQETGDLIQIYPDTRDPTFPNGSSYVWDYGFLPPGTWVVVATDGSRYSEQTLVIDPQPVIQVTEPDAAGGRDYARSVLGDAYDLTNPQDVTRDGGTNQVADLQFTAQGLTGTTTGNDPFVSILDDALRRPGTERAIDASTFRHLTFTLEYDRKDLTFNQALGPDYGGIARVIWRAAGNNGGPLTNTQDIFLIDGGPRTFSMDLGSFDSFGDCPTCELEDVAGRDLWRGPISVLRIDPLEAQLPRWFRLADIRIAADDEPNPNGFFTIRWNAFDATFSREIAGSGAADARVALFYDNDTSATNGRVQIPGAESLPATTGAFNWNVAGLAPGRYYVYAVITDPAGNSHAGYSGGPVGLATTYTSRTFSTWAAAYGVTDPNADDDADGHTNQQEFQLATNPVLSNTWSLPEGATGFFVERIALANPDPTPANVMLTFLRKSGPPITRDFTVMGHSRLSIVANDVAGLEQAEFSTVVTATMGGVVAERTMFWGDQRYGGHGGKAVQSARTEWYFAEGDANFFDTWVLLANATPESARVRITFLLPGGGTVVRTYDVPPQSRETVFANLIPELVGLSFGARIESTVPITVERAMYFSNQGRFWNGGHVAAAVPGPATEWFVAEGRTGELFDEYLLLANPNGSGGKATVRYLLRDRSPVEVTYDLPANSRTTLFVDQELATRGITEADVSARVTATVPIIVERSMYWPGNSSQWYEAHASAGVTASGTRWVLAEGEQGGAIGFDTYILIANPSDRDAMLRFRVLKTGGSGAVMDIPVKANSRETLNATQLGVVSGEQFGVLVDSTNGVPIVVERAMYWNGAGAFWGGGTNETGTRLR